MTGSGLSFDKLRMSGIALYLPSGPSPIKGESFDRLRMSGLSLTPIRAFPVEGESFDKLRMSRIALTPGPLPEGEERFLGYEFRLEMGHPGCQWATVSDGAAIHLKREIAGRRLDFIIRFPWLDVRRRGRGGQ